MKDGFFYDTKSLDDSWSAGLFVLLYHSIERPPLRHPWRGLYVTPQKLRRQLAGLKDSGLPFVSLTDWARQPSAQRAVALTLDDAMKNVFTHALPVLQSLGLPAITFVVANLIGDSNRWDHAAGGQKLPLMDRSEILAWIQAGHEIGSHGLTHCNLTQIPLAEARREIIDSKKILEDITSTPVRHFCYPYGSQNEALREIVREAGYETACGTGTGTNSPSADKFNLARVLARHRFPAATAVREALLG